MANAYVEIDGMELTLEEYERYTYDPYAEFKDAVDNFNKGVWIDDREIAYKDREPFRPGIEVLAEMNRKFGFPDKNGSML